MIDMTRSEVGKLIALALAKNEPIEACWWEIYHSGVCSGELILSDLENVIILPQISLDIYFVLRQRIVPYFSDLYERRTLNSDDEHVVYFLVNEFGRDCLAIFSNDNRYASIEIIACRPERGRTIANILLEEGFFERSVTNLVVNKDNMQKMALA